MFISHSPPRVTVRRRRGAGAGQGSGKIFPPSPVGFVLKNTPAHSTGLLPSPARNARVSAALYHENLVVSQTENPRSSGLPRSPSAQGLTPALGRPCRRHSTALSFPAQFPGAGVPAASLLPQVQEESETSSWFGFFLIMMMAVMACHT